MYNITDADWRAYVSEPIAPRKRAPRKAKPSVSRETKGPTLDELRVMCIAAGLKVTTKHIKAELAAMIMTGVYVRPAALNRAKAARASKKKEA